MIEDRQRYFYGKEDFIAWNPEFMPISFQGSSFRGRVHSGEESRETLQSTEYVGLSSAPYTCWWTAPYGAIPPHVEHSLRRNRSQISKDSIKDNQVFAVNVFSPCQLDLSRQFEKSLYDLIRGLRNHKGNEGEYIQNSLRECRTEIKSQDMDKKATALLKLIYLEMFGYDMSWAAFHVLEVMSSPQYLQRGGGYPCSGPQLPTGY
ncbi:AP-3 complex subunit delta [Coccidioides immitis H538.4]|uniref:AP-3 complex subunit delta n=1 Tax=Coccidioides immitis H538.4 TaxID=396776 RepID=A0A0J8S615_COCIT|nr:AP-3 complex subunit delta [Coccidioides immitis H538.4]